MDWALWTTNAINLSSMALRPGATRGNGYRRDYTKDPSTPTWAPRTDIVINDNNQGVYISNPFYMLYKPAGTTINVSGIGPPTSNGPPEKDRPAPDPNFPVIYPAKVTSAPKEALKSPQIKQNGKPEPVGYIQWGYDRMSRASLQKIAGVTDFWGFCDEGTCLAVAILSQQTYYTIAGTRYQNPIPKDTLIEAVSCVVTTTSGTEMKHIFCVVNRKADSNIKSPTTWGDACFAVDQWYGLQAYKCPAMGTPVGAVQTVFKVSNIGQEPEATYFGAIQGADRNALNVEGQFPAGSINIMRPSQAAKDVSAGQ